MSGTPGELISSGFTPGEETQVIEVSTDEIENLLRSRFTKEGWSATFDWDTGQWPRMIVRRSRETKA